MVSVGSNITSAKYVDPAVSDNINRVIQDGGVFVDATGAQLTWERLAGFNPSLTNFCRAGKASLLYSYTLITS